ncbi:MAG: CinA family protein, partial [Bacteroidota bacterium]
LAARLLQVPGASAYIQGGIVAYDNQIKRDLLAVHPLDLESEGAVSAPVVRAMAQEACRILHCDYAIAISGIAGPDGGSPEKPVGTVFFGIHGPEGTRVYQRSLGEGRALVVERAVMMAMFLLWRVMVGHALPEETSKG